MRTGRDQKRRIVRIDVVKVKAGGDHLFD